MSALPPPSRYLILFDGQGSPPSSLRALLPLDKDDPSDISALFINQCASKFTDCINALSSTALATLINKGGIKKDLLAKSPLPYVDEAQDTAIRNNPLFAIPNVYILQILRYLALYPSLTALSNGSNANVKVDVIGFSSGILPALAITSSSASESGSSGILNFLHIATELFEIAFWVGYHAQLGRMRMLDEACVGLDDPVRDFDAVTVNAYNGNGDMNINTNTWSCVLFGLRGEEVDDAVERFNVGLEPATQITHTSHTTRTTHSVSGLPSSLNKFITFLNSESTSITTRPAPIHTLYHSSYLAHERNLLFERINACVGKSKILESLAIPSSSSSSSSSTTTAALTLYNQSTGLPLPPTLTGTALIKEIVDMILIKPVNLVEVVRGVLGDVRGWMGGGDDSLNLIGDANLKINIVNIGPGVGLAKTLGRMLSSSSGSSSGVESASASASAIGIAGVNLKISTSIEDYSTEEYRSVKASASSNAKNRNNVDAAAVAIDDEDPLFEPIAIVGMGVNFPGASDPEELWRLLESGGCTVSEIPPSRFSISQYRPTPSQPVDGAGRTVLKTSYGNFLPFSGDSPGSVAGFDNSLFKISPREAKIMDPQQRVLMRVAFRALEHAGYVGCVEDGSKGNGNGGRSEGFSLVDGHEDPRSAVKRGLDGSGNGKVVFEYEENGEDRERCGVFVGVATNDYVQNLRSEIGVHYATSTLPAFLCGRISYYFNLSGPSVVINTACSSSLVALHSACRSLQNGECDTALAGGVNVVTSPDIFLGLDRAHFLSSSGNCRPFEATADGYCRAEGCGLFVLKRLSTALKSNDRILGVVRSSGINQSAAAQSITYPHAPTQAALVRRVLREAGVRPERIGVVEAHGTGTQAGDPNEVAGIRSILSDGMGRTFTSNPLYIGSIKGNIGHAEAAAGAAGLAKLLVMLKTRKIPKQVGLVTLNPKIEKLESDGVIIEREGGKDWERRKVGESRVALLNNFGAAGSNAACIVEEAPEAPERPAVGTPKDNDSVVVAFSAESEKALNKLRDLYIATLVNLAKSSSNGVVDPADIVDFAYTTTARRKVRPWRMSLSLSNANKLSSEEIKKQLGAVQGMKGEMESGKIVFLFSGQGGQRLGMGQDLYSFSKVFRGVVDDAHEKLVRWGYPGVLRILDPKVGETFEKKEDELVAYQCALFVLEYGLYRMWTEWGVRPDVVAGHSLGEYAALVASSVITPDAALRIVAHRARLMTLHCAQNTSGMLAVRLAPESIPESFSKQDGCADLKVACNNSASDVVIGGPLDQLAKLQAHLKTIPGCKMLALSVPYAYHTSAMEPIYEPLVEYTSKFEFSAPKIPIVSNVAGRLVSIGEMDVFDAEYFAKHCRQTVQFTTGIDDLASQIGKVGVWLELGPQPTTLPMIAHLSSANNALAIHSLHKQTSARTALSASLSKLYTTRGHSIKWRNVFDELFRGSKIAELPDYPMFENTHWVEFKEEEAAAPVVVTAPVKVVEPSLSSKFAFLDKWIHKPSALDPNVSEFETPIEMLATFITGHQVGSHPLCPASVYYELALAAATCTLETTDARSFAEDLLALSEIQFSHPLIYNADALVKVRTTINFHPPGGKYAGTFTISSVKPGQENGTSHCTGCIQRRRKDTAEGKLQLHRANIERKVAAFHAPEGPLPETYRTRTIYDLVFPRVVQYSKPYQVIEAMSLDSEGVEAIATMKLPADYHRGPFVMQPVFVDTLLHAGGFVINRAAASNEAYICSQVDSAKMIYDIDFSAGYDIYTSIQKGQDGLVMADAWAMESTGAMRVVAHLKRMRFQRLRINSLHRLLAAASGAPPKKESATAAPKIHAPAPVQAQSRPSLSKHKSSLSNATTVVESSVDISTEVFKLVAGVCGVPMTDLSMQSDLADLGVDSLMWIEIVGQLAKLVAAGAIAVDSAQLMLSHTLGELVGKLAPGDQTPRTSSPSPTAADVHEDIVALTPRSYTGMKVTFPEDLEVPDRPITSGPSSGANAREVLSKVLEVAIDDLNDDDDFDSLGLDSLGSIEAINGLQEQFGLTLPADFFHAYPTVGAVQKYIAGASISRSSSRSGFSKQTLADTPPKVESPKPIAVSVPVKEMKILLQNPTVASGPSSRANAREVLSQVLEVAIDDLNDDDDFDSLGLDSLGSIEAINGLQEQFGLNLPTNFFHSYPTVGAVQKYIASACVSRSSSRSGFAKQTFANAHPKVESPTPTAISFAAKEMKAILQIQSAPDGFKTRPLFLVHDGSGLGNCYSRISSLGRSVYAISNPKLLSGSRFEGGIPQMSGQYVEQAIPHISSQGCIIGGWSFGGVVAFHMACDLIRAGVNVAGVVLIDAPSPFTENPLPDELIDGVISSGEMGQSRIVELARIQMKNATRSLVGYNIETATNSIKVLPKLVMIRCSGGFNVRALPGCENKKMPFLEDRSDPKRSTKDWERLTGQQIPILDIPGHHFEPFVAHVPEVSKRISEAIALLEQGL